MSNRIRHDELRTKEAKQYNYNKFFKLLNVVLFPLVDMSEMLLQFALRLFHSSIKPLVKVPINFLRLDQFSKIQSKVSMRRKKKVIFFLKKKVDFFGFRLQAYTGIHVHIFLLA